MNTTLPEFERIRLRYFLNEVLQIALTRINSLEFEFQLTSSRTIHVKRAFEQWNVIKDNAYKAQEALKKENFKLLVNCLKSLKHSLSDQATKILFDREINNFISVLER